MVQVQPYPTYCQATGNYHLNVKIN